MTWQSLYLGDDDGPMDAVIRNVLMRIGSVAGRFSRQADNMAQAAARLLEALPEDGRTAHQASYNHKESDHEREA